MPTISAAAIIEKLNSCEHFYIIDVRTPYEWQEYSLPDDERIIYKEMNEISEYIQSLDKSTPLYILCRSGNRSGIVTTYLKENNFNAYNIEDGIMQIRFLKSCRA